MAKVTFIPYDKVVEVPIGENFLELNKKEKLRIRSSCGGAPSCTQCRMVIKKGEELLSPIERKESDLMGTSFYLTKVRLACQTKVIAEGEIEIDLTEHTEKIVKDENFVSSFRKKIPKGETKKTEEKKGRVTPRKSSKNQDSRKKVKPENEKLEVKRQKPRKSKGSSKTKKRESNQTDSNSKNKPS